jgi:membrane protease subunit HflK
MPEHDASQHDPRDEHHDHHPNGDEAMDARPVVFQGLEAGLRMFRWVVLILLVLFLFSGLETIQSGFVGLKLRFGRLVGASRSEQIHEPGLVLALPEPIDTVITVDGPEREGEVIIDEVWKPIEELAAIDKINPLVEGYVLTGDQNIVQAKLRVKYRVTDPIRFKLWMDNPEGMLQDAVLAALTRTIGGWEVNDVWRQQRGGEEGVGTAKSLADMVKTRAQDRLDRLDAGMTISALEFAEIHPPRHVVAEFRDVQNARIEMETKKREAEGFVRSLLPKAESESNQMVKQAMAYENALKAEAGAELSVFEQIHAEYQNNPEVVRERLLLETFEQMIQEVGKRLFLPPGTRLILPLQDMQE